MPDVDGKWKVEIRETWKVGAHRSVSQDVPNGYSVVRNESRVVIGGCIFEHFNSTGRVKERSQHVDKPVRAGLAWRRQVRARLMRRVFPEHLLDGFFEQAFRSLTPGEAVTVPLEHVDAHGAAQGKFPTPMIEMGKSGGTVGGLAANVAGFLAGVIRVHAWTVAVINPRAAPWR
jgi:hypothetical protein